jgi:signal transduction histidine kinase
VQLPRPPQRVRWVSESGDYAALTDVETIASPRSPLNQLRRFLPRGDTLPGAVWEKRHRFLIALLAAHALVLPIFGMAMGYSVVHSILEGGLIPGTVAMAALLIPGPRKLRAGLVSLGLLSCSALLTHFSGGYIEAHFHFFIVIVIIGLYEDWLPFGLALAYVVLHHGIGGAIDPSSVYNHPAAQQHPWRWAAIHGVAISMAGALSIWTWKLNEELRAQKLTASRARLVAAADETRRRIQRDVHDGAQQRLVHTVITLKLAKATLGDAAGPAAELVDEALLNAERATAELRELVHGILPAALSRGGLRAGVEALVGHINLPVSIDVPSQRLPTTLETTAYFIVAEALTNVVKHAGAGSAHVRAVVDGGALHLDVRDNGAGGADCTRGTGLVGLADRSPPAAARSRSRARRARAPRSSSSSRSGTTDPRIGLRPDRRPETGADRARSGGSMRRRAAEAGAGGRQVVDRRSGLDSGVWGESGFVPPCLDQLRSAADGTDEHEGRRAWLGATTSGSRDVQ